LEFKSKWYNLEDANPKIAESAKGELIKDILSLANGNTNVAGEKSYLIIGVSDELNNGVRDLSDVVSQKPITRQRLLDIVNAVCEPAIEDILCDPLTVDGKRLIAITIFPSPHVFETIKELKTSRPSYDPYTVFVRHGDGVRTASTKERIALQQLKKLRFTETRNVPPMPFGAFIGALIAGAMGPKILENKQDSQKQKNTKTLASILVGGMLGGIIGLNYEQIKSFSITWQQASRKGKVVGAMGGSAALIFSLWISKILSRKND
jgi:predicted HTH transcriptional regulator